FRQNLLGKRVDYSGRSVIVVGPELKLHQCGLPKKMALELFKPFVIKEILEKELSYNVRGASKLIEQETDEVWAILEQVVKDKFVLLNRAPTLHRLGIQAFVPVLVEGEAIRIHPFVCRAFNADFDGDQMSVHVPLGEEAQLEAKEIMLSSLNLLKPATGNPIVSPSQDIVLGLYWLTKIKPGVKGENKAYSSQTEAEMALELGELDLRAKIKIKVNDEIVETSLGRVLFNSVLPEDYPFVNSLMHSKEIERIFAEVIRKYGQEEREDILDRIKNLGFKYATLSGVSWGMDDLMVPEEKKEIIQKAEKEVENIENYFKKGLLSPDEKTSKVIELWAGVKAEIEKLVPKTLPEFGPVYTIIDSGARGSWSQPAQMAGMKGLVINPAGQIIELPIKSSFKEGFDPLEYFISTHGARKGTADTALRTAAAGYLTRRLVDVAQDVVIREKDCKDKIGWELSKKEAEESDQKFIYKIKGRMTVKDIKSGQKIIVKAGEIIGWDEAKIIADDEKIERVIIRSPLSCQSKRGICQSCYGWDLGKNELVELGTAVGVIAAQAIGEPGTQLTMKTFHTGGVAGVSDITTGLPRIEEVFEARIPKGKALIAQADGQVLEITSDNIIKVKSNKVIVNYHASLQSVIMVKKGDKIEKGQQLSEGNFDLKEHYKLHSKEETQRYIIQEIQRIYASQGVSIHDKHIEIIVRKMFSRVKIKESGDSLFVPGEVVELARILEENDILKKEKKQLIKFSPVLLGITRVSLSTDSFLSAASFQETSRVLIKASLEGKEDRLLGPKENIIIGKIVPIGTGFKK
ncbi:MAG: DNA-directed RNA polymerase subunit beta', partial [Candidatus Pacebacteria bacterium]|nr:DNA-directed RNA polymerase subunit beta' [Candidatus Paceibacterota bacterium]